jgi:2-keto-3-deoxy-L-rhamnonate aldolase RhmA
VILAPGVGRSGEVSAHAAREAPAGRRRVCGGSAQQVRALDDRDQHATIDDQQCVHVVVEQTPGDRCRVPSR